MNQTETEKVKRFMSDIVMSNAVHHILLQSFLKKKERKDVNMTAAERIAIDLLEDGWKELEKLKAKQTVEKKEFEQVGL